MPRPLSPILLTAFLLSSALLHAQSYQPRIDRIVLDNGLSVVLHRDTTVTDVAVILSFRAGSAFDPAKKKGLASIVGSLYMTPTSAVPNETVQRLQRSGAGATAALTDVDAIHISAYYQAGFLESVLWMEADRMRSGGAHFDKTRLDAIVERLQEQYRKAASRPLFDLNKKSYEELYPDGHPYKSLTNGEPSQWKTITLKDCRSFAAQWLVPNNASLTISGNFRIEDATAWVTRYFSSIPANRKLHIPSVPALPPLGQASIVHEDNISTTRLSLVFPTVPFGHPDEPVLQLLAHILAGSSNSYLHVLLAEEDPTITSIEAHQSSQALDGNLWITINGTIEADLQKFYERVMETIAVLKREAVIERDLLEARNAVEMAVLSPAEDISGVSGRAFVMNRANLLLKDPLAPFTQLDRLAQISMPMIQQALTKYCTVQNQMLLSVVPVGKGSRAARPLK